MINSLSQYRLPAEWEKHRATWIAWPHEKSDWPGKFESIKWVFVDFVRIIGQGEMVEILANSPAVAEEAEDTLKRSQIPCHTYRIHLVPNDRSWLRDSAPTGVLSGQNELIWIGWKFNAWAKYENFSSDSFVASAISEISGKNIVWADRAVSAGEANSFDPLVLEGGAIDTDGEGTLLVTEECLLSPVQERNPGLSKADYELLFKHYLGIEKTIWLKSGIAGDDTHGHIDDLARFVAPGKVVTVLEKNSSEENYQATHSNLEILKNARDAKGRNLEVFTLPMPEPVIFGTERLPASYANFYISNKSVLVPTFNDPADITALNLFNQLFPHREIVGINCRDFVLGQGTIHCSTQQEPSN